MKPFHGTAAALAAVVLAGVAAARCAGAAAAEDYPSRPLRLIVPFAAGGGNDTVARTLALRLGDRLGQPVVVDNRGGAGGVLGAELAARAPADGYTLFLGGVGSHAINPTLHAHLPYDAVRDFAPVALVAVAPLILVVHPSLPVHSVPELIRFARERPQPLAFASNGNGSSAQLAAELFNAMAGLSMTHIPYKGLSPALADLLTGQVQLMFSSMVAILPQVRAGRLRALAVTGRRRSALLPELPTIAETGLSGYEASSWYGVLVPAGTPRPVVLRLNAAIGRTLQEPDVQARLAADGAEAAGGTPEEFAGHIAAESARLGRLIRSIGIHLE